MRKLHRIRVKNDTELLYNNVVDELIELYIMCLDKYTLSKYIGADISRYWRPLTEISLHLSYIYSNDIFVTIAEQAGDIDYYEDIDSIIHKINKVINKKPVAKKLTPWHLKMTTDVFLNKFNYGWKRILREKCMHKYVDNFRQVKRLK